MAEFLIRNGSEIDATTQNNITALMFASAYNLFYMVDMLLYYEAGLDYVDLEGNNALMLATFYGNSEIIKLLIKHVATIETVDKKGNSILHKAIESNDSATVSLIIDLGLNQDFMNYQEITPLALASKNGSERDRKSVV